MPDPAPGYTFCTSGRALAACKRCGAIICSEDAAFDLHNAFHAQVNRAALGLPLPLGGIHDQPK